jgi:hypothetical protein
MRQLAPDERLVVVMAYTPNMLVRGGLIAREGVRVSIWLRTQGVPSFIHLVNSQALIFGDGAPRSVSYTEMYLPTSQVIAFHIAPPAADPLDYDPNEANRAMVPVTALIGTFIAKAKLRVSTQTDLATSLEVLHTTWVSLYDAEISNPNLAQFSIKVPMMLINADVVGIGV